MQLRPGFRAQVGFELNPMMQYHGIHLVKWECHDSRHHCQ